MFISSPLKDNDNNEDIIGIVALRNHVGIPNNLMQSYAYGKASESYLVNRKGYMLTECFFLYK